jgi:hypothetical protein
MEKSFKVGDRYRHKFDKDVWEVVSKKYVKLIEHGEFFNEHNLNIEIDICHISHAYKYIGNFAKSNNFKTIYEILNSGK